jgi:tetratricopeptide (TPR) repeat protein
MRQQQRTNPKPSEESEPIYRRVIDLFERRLASGDSKAEYDIAINLNNLGAVCQATDRLEEAETLYRRALAIKETLLGADHPDVAVTLNNRALLLKQQGNPAEAATMYKRALAIFERTVTPTHPNFITCRTNYERLQRRLSQPSPNQNS